MDHISPLYGISFNGYPGNNQVLEAAMACVQVLSRMKLEDNVIFHVLGKLFEGLSAAPLQNKSSTVPGEVFFSTKNSETSYSNGNPSLDSSKAGEVIEHEKIFITLLMKAFSHGAFQLKDVVSALQCLETPSLDRMKRKDVLKTIQGENNSITTTELEKKSCSHCKRKLTDNGFGEEGSVEKVSPHGPMDNYPPVIALDSGPHAAAHPSDRDLSLSPEAQGQEQSSSLHVTEVGHCSPQNLAGGSSFENVPTPHAKSSGSPLLNKEVSFQKIPFSHVGSLPSSISSLEATKQGAITLPSPSPFNGNEIDSQQASALSDGSLIFKVEHDILQKRTELCRFSVLGKLSLAKGDDPWTWKKLKIKLDEVWGMKEWRLISIGKGFFLILLNNQEDLCKVWNKGALRLKPGVLRLQQWQFGFDPAKEKNTLSPVWFRLSQLPWCLWDASVINGIARKVGVPLRIDRNTLEGSFGHYARVLVEVDLSKQVPSKVLIDCCGKLMEVSIVPENLPPFCHGCKSIGHSEITCRALLKMKKGPHLTKSTNAAKKTLSGKNGDERIHVDSSAVARNGPSWRRKETNDDLPPTAKVSNFTGSVDMVTAFSSQDNHPSLKNGHDRILLSNHFSVLDMDDEVVEMPHNTENDSHLEPNSKLCEDEEIIIPKLPQRWSDILDEEDEVEAAPIVQTQINDVLLPPLQHSSKEMETIFTHGIKPISMDDQTENTIHSHPRMDISELRAQLDNIWVKRDDSRYDRDMYAEIDRGPYSPKHVKTLSNLLPKKEKKVKISFRQPQRHLDSSRKV